jgi:hypothetical protein
MGHRAGEEDALQVFRKERAIYRNGRRANVADLQVGDIAAVKYDLTVNEDKVIAAEHFRAAWSTEVER